MYEIFYWPTPNGKKVTILLEECGLEYKITPVNIQKGDQFNKDFLEMNPNHRMPVMVDHKPKDGGAPISVFDTDDEAVAAANDTEFGLVSYLYTENLTRALRISEALESGMIGLNTGLVSNPAAPFGGIKQSGLGREGGAQGIEEYLETKYVAVGLG